MIVVVDYGVGNFGSVKNMLKIAGFDCRLSAEKDEILAAEKIILPGIGSFDAAMQRLKDSDLSPLIIEKAITGTPTLGICLGAQLLSAGSEEGALPGLGLLEAECRKFDVRSIAPLKVPHMGWDEIEIFQTHPVMDFEDMVSNPKFYFAHSYYLKASDDKATIAKCTYGHSFDCVLASGNIIAAQFHPEKSHKFGLRLFSNFAHWKYEKS
jgi:imidazole glycerol-phosphate synthase subunit HisH